MRLNRIIRRAPSSLVLFSSVLIPALCTGQTLVRGYGSDAIVLMHAVDDRGVSDRDTRHNRTGQFDAGAQPIGPDSLDISSPPCEPESAAASRRPQDRDPLAQSFEQLQVLVGRGGAISVQERSGEEFSARIADLTTTELVVMVDGRRRVFQPDDAIRIRQRRGDSLANGTWLGFGVGAGIGLLAVASDDSGLLNNAGWAVVAAAVYGSMGAAVGVGVDALIRGRHVIYDHRPSAPPPVEIIPLVSMKRVGAALALRF